MSRRTRPCDAAVRSGRMRKAGQFADAAAIIRDFADDEAEIGDAYVTLLVHAGIAAADVVCCAELGEHAQGESHHAAVELLRSVRRDGPELALALGVLLGAKTQAGYGHRPVSRDARARCARASARLLRAARDRGASG